MSMLSLSLLAVTAAVLGLALRRHNSEIALLLTLGCSVLLLLSVLDRAASVIGTVQSIAAASGINSGYIAILLRVIGICLLTEFAANTCRDSGSSALASNVTLAGKLLAAAAALPLYADIFNAVAGMITQ